MSEGGAVGLIVLVIALIAVGCLAGCPAYNVYTSEMKGKAAYAEAQQNRNITVLEAQADLDAAKLSNQAEIERAKGVAEANKIIGDSLAGKDEYLRYLWITGLKENQADIIYVPTEAGLPILEAGRAAPKVRLGFQGAN